MLPCFAIEFNDIKFGKEENLLTKVGFTILNANRIPYRMNFILNSKTSIVNAYTKYRDREIVLYKGMLAYIDSEDELAAILAHENAHGVDYNQGAFRGYFTYISTSLNSKKYETKADKRAVDYLVKAGYNPLASIVILNKIASQTRYDWCSSHPLTSKRLATIYEHIYTKYPEYLVDNKYKDNIYYQNFLITSKENRKKFEQKVKSNSRKSVNYL